MSSGLERLKRALQSKGLRETAFQIGGAAIAGGPVGAATAVLGRIADAVGAQQGASVEELSAAIQSATPEQLSALAEIEKEQTRRLEIAVADVQNARAVHGTHWMTWFLPLLIAAMWCAWRVALIYADVSVMTPEAIADTSGVLNNLLVLAFGYWLGSSRGSAVKEQSRHRAQRDYI